MAIGTVATAGGGLLASLLLLVVVMVVVMLGVTTFLLPLLLESHSSIAWRSIVQRLSTLLLLPLVAMQVRALPREKKIIGRVHSHAHNSEASRAPEIERERGEKTIVTIIIIKP